MFSKNIRTVYLYAVCFITLMMVIGGVIATVDAVATFYYPPTWGNQTDRMRNIINSIAVWAISAPIFTLHWWQALKLRKKEVAEDGNVADTND